jgi:hypothetical protein
MVLLAKKARRKMRIPNDEAGVNAKKNDNDEDARSQ